MNYTLVPLKAWAWSDDYSFHRVMTCVNHQNLRWSTKNPWWRSVFYVGAILPDGTDAPLWSVPECKCPVSDWRVIAELSADPAVTTP